MLKFLIQRLFYGLLVLWGVVSMVFFLFNILPGDPAKMLTGQRADADMLASIRKELGLNQKLGVQYVQYLNDLSPISIFQKHDAEAAFFFDAEKYRSAIPMFQTERISVVLKPPYLRKSWQSRREVSEILSEAFPKTFLLAFTSIAFAMLAGMLIGTIAAVVNRNWLNRLLLVVTVFGMSLPSFFAAILVAWIFAYLLSDFTGLSMFGSLYSIDNLGRGEYLDLKNLILPAFTLGIRPLAIVTELMRTSLLEVFSQDYIRTARAKGLSMKRVVLVHAMKNALNPVVTAVSGWFASLLAGAVFVEYVFDWKGIGVVVVDALEKFDLPVLMGAVLLIAVILIIINIFVDILYGILDPRIRTT